MDRTGVLQEIRMLRFEEIHDRFTKGRLSAAEAAEWLGVSEGSVRSRGSLPRAPPADRFPGPVLRDQESRHELPALPIIVDHRAGRANGSWLPALPVPGLRAAIQRAEWHGAEPGSGPDRHR